MKGRTTLKFKSVHVIINTSLQLLTYIDFENQILLVH